MMYEEEIASILSAAFIEINNKCSEGSGISANEHAQLMGAAIAKIIPYIQENADVATTLSGVAGPYPLAGSGTGGVV